MRLAILCQRGDEHVRQQGCRPHAGGAAKSGTYAQYQVAMRMNAGMQLQSANQTTREVLGELAEAQGQIQYLQEHMEHTAPQHTGDVGQLQPMPSTKDGASSQPSVVFSNAQLPLVSAATLTDHYGLDTPMNPGLTGTFFDPPFGRRVGCF